MAHYLVQVAYTSEAWANLVKKPQSRMEVVGAAIENLGGRIEGAWLTFGDYDTIGSALAKDCRDETDTIWNHNLLRHNASELDRLREHVRPILF